jgi:hypothetical protein
MKRHRHLSILLALAGVLAAAGVNAQYADELGKLAPEALKGWAKPQPAQLKEIAPGLYFFWSNYSFTPSVEGWIALLRRAAKFEADVFIGGHGDVSTREDLLEYAQMHEDFPGAVKAGLAEGKNREELADTIRMQEYSHYRNYHRIHGWTYALHHLLTTGKPMAPYP